MIDIIEKMKTEMLRRKYSIRTITAYCDVVIKFLKKTRIEDVRRIKKSDIKDYLNSLHEKSGSTINVHLNALKFTMEEILHKNCYVHIKYSKVPLKETDWLTKEETLSLFDAIENEKHKLMIMFLYSSGMRVSELVNLKVCDIDFNKNSGIIRHGKGNKDRIFIIAQKIKRDLMEFIRNNKTNNLTGNAYLFKGRNGHISQRMIQVILNNAAEKAKITKNVHPHVLRHSFAKHLEFNGSSPFTIQALLGHSDLRTTMRYLHTSVPVIGVKSPIDSL
ncbi:tyrosine-type recombinase/integrase [Candidatus Woesearchaeota archaeon]|nr:tyrosine-type recombinase/integrase [Candidatus Woesearchaeota archaeon]